MAESVVEQWFGSTRSKTHSQKRIQFSMSDTRQIVRWSLERPCRFRSGLDWFLPDETCKQLGDLRTISNAASENRIVDGICVTSWTLQKDNSGKSHNIPHSGFRIEERIGKFGNLNVLKEVCGSCEANVNCQVTMNVAGCFGYMDVWPDSEELNEQLWHIIREKNLEERLRQAFQVTSPLWYGFWIKSPLRRMESELLQLLLADACDFDDPRDKDIVHFLNALKAAIHWELPLHVALAPLGHADLGWYTVFPYCPKCKANAKVGRWKENYSDEEYECTVCGHVFCPNDHHSSKEDNFDGDMVSLKDQLGQQSYWEFVTHSLLFNGCTKELANEVIDIERNGPLLRGIANIREQRNRTIGTIRRKRIASSTKPDSKTSFQLTQGIELKLVLVPAGEFLMGVVDAEYRTMESPQHIVRFDQPFYIGQYPITQSQWEAIMGPTRFRVTDPNLPVDQVSWFDCQYFCEKLSALTNRVFRLPSEAEWEYACRAGTTTKYSFGDILSVWHANFTPMHGTLGSSSENRSDTVRELELLIDSEIMSPRKQKKGLTRVGTYAPNAWDIYDMHGNVEEWCEDAWNDNYKDAPIDGRAWISNESTHAFRVVRGGWCSGSENTCTSSFRRQLRADAGTPSKSQSKAEHDSDLEYLLDMMYSPHGFRVVCEV